MISLPDNQKGVVGFSPTLIIVDEASRVSDELYLSIRPMLSLGRCQMVTLSTPFGSRGWFYELWRDPVRLNAQRWWRITVDHCPRISREFLARERIEIGDRWFRQEYYCEFVDVADSVFQAESIRHAMTDDVIPLFE